jgi:hypothetical protein
MKPYAIPSELLNSPAFLPALQVVAGRSIREQSRQRFGRMLEAHMYVSGVLGSALLRRNGVYALIKGDSQRQIVLIAGFVQGLHIVECAITEGYYLQAAALLRQELETVAALEELKDGIRRDKTTPNVKHVPWSLATLYGDLSSAAHQGRHDLLRQVLDPQYSDLPVNTTAVSSVPTFQSDLAWRMYGLHVALLIQLAVHLHEHHKAVHGGGLSDAEVGAVERAQALLVEEGVLTKIQ